METISQQATKLRGSVVEERSARDLPDDAAIAKLRHDLAALGYQFQFEASTGAFELVITAVAPGAAAAAPGATGQFQFEDVECAMPLD
jgi:hypothetical protein